MVSRAADATILGYYYQFDTAILKLLQLSRENDFIDIEGIEDIDINTATEITVVQCKYLSKPKFINSAVREPIILMLDHFVNPATPNNLKYTLYAHFENENPGTEVTIDLARLKAILTYTENKTSIVYNTDKGISDSQLTSFLSQFKFVFGYEFKVQQQQVINLLKSQFKCSEVTADTHFYNNALRVIIDKAKERHLSQRRVIKKEFLNTIDRTKVLFNEWYIKLRSKREYIKIVSEDLRTSRALHPSKSKFILIGGDLFMADNSTFPISSLIENIIEKYYKLNSALRDAKPVVIILGCDNATLINLKKEMIISGINFNDGYEHIEFNIDMFNKEPVINRSRNENKIAQSSFLVKIISQHTFITNLNLLKKTKVVLHFSKNDCPCPPHESYQWYDINYCENFKDIATLIA
jgi:hypothetical protein